MRSEGRNSNGQSKLHRQSNWLGIPDAPRSRHQMHPRDSNSDLSGSTGLAMSGGQSLVVWHLLRSTRNSRTGGNRTRSVDFFNALHDDSYACRLLSQHERDGKIKGTLRELLFCWGASSDSRLCEMSLSIDVRKPSENRTLTKRKPIRSTINSRLNLIFVKFNLVDFQFRSSTNRAAAADLIVAL
jgi:hypothetical protein